jgi:hypothetical protein
MEFVISAFAWRLKKTTEILCPGRDSNPESNNYKASELIDSSSNFGYIMRSEKEAILSWEVTN